MTLEEARKVAMIIINADNGCPVCVERLVEKAQEIFPEFKWTFNETEAWEVEIFVDQI